MYTTHGHHVAGTSNADKPHVLFACGGENACLLCDNEAKLYRAAAISDECKPASIYDPVNKPEHYNSHPSGIECITVTRHMSFNLGNVVKYLWRDGLKDGVPDIQDLEKAAWYLNDEIATREAFNV